MQDNENTELAWNSSALETRISSTGAQNGLRQYLGAKELSSARLQQTRVCKPRALCQNPRFGFWKCKTRVSCSGFSYMAL